MHVGWNSPSLNSVYTITPLRVWLLPQLITSPCMWLLTYVTGFRVVSIHCVNPEASVSMVRSDARSNQCYTVRMCVMCVCDVCVCVGGGGGGVSWLGSPRWELDVRSLKELPMQISRGSKESIIWQEQPFCYTIGMGKCMHWCYHTNGLVGKQLCTRILGGRGDQIARGSMFDAPNSGYNCLAWRWPGAIIMMLTSLCLFS
jgi:hypothetical protein